ncbi:response regulator transcription factor [Desnuesiella massiliensis]|uniref:response regulator transcription factor n=1 Tax=Desnuesiella massiliensis TaxID=1650662 RepID=UPI0006E45196|nr:response regulator transcription factor [Desnuesiella massiliensis]
MNKYKILIVEDEFSINDILTIALSKEGYRVRNVFNGKDALEVIEDFNPDLVLLDLMLPDIDGFDICKRISHKYLVIMLTARNEIIDRVLGLELGADDYIAKPFDIREVCARIKALFRRLNNEERSCNYDEFKDINSSIKINIKSRILLKDETEIFLKRKEFDLLLFLYENRNRVFSREELLDKVWGYEYEGDTRTVDVHIRRIRAKLDSENKESIIETVFGIGYVMR